MKKCVDCGRERKIICTCPSCKTGRCMKCWTDHLAKKVCKYGQATVMDVRF